ncbi:MAG: HisA/HisF-related TIM barrel protein [Stellaceae bacterium]
MNPFSIVPVLDLKGGDVVHARAGDRARYRPIRSPLASSSEPGAVLEGLLALAPFPRFYIADLDAIEGCGSHRAIVAALARAHPAIEFWIDAGLTTAAAAAAMAEAGLVPVLGSETLAAPEELAAAHHKGTRCVLSLDYRDERFLGPEAVATRPELWPDRVIVMTLSRVGSGAGPDLARLDAVRRSAGPRQIFAAGGVRDGGDIARLTALGIAGALVATALHDGRLDRATVNALLAER